MAASCWRQASLDAYTKASHRLGRDITRSAIFAALSVEGVQNVVLREPAQDIVISRQEAPSARAPRSPMRGPGVTVPRSCPRLHAAGKGARTGRRAAARCRGGDPRCLVARRLPARPAALAGLGLSLDNWSTDWPESIKRERVRKAIAIARRKGTAESVRSVVASFGGSVAIREWWQSEPGACRTRSA
jgi:hypothetical protein